MSPTSLFQRNFDGTFYSLLCICLMCCDKLTCLSHPPDAQYLQQYFLPVPVAFESTSVIVLVVPQIKGESFPSSSFVPSPWDGICILELDTSLSARSFGSTEGEWSCFSTLFLFFADLLFVVHCLSTCSSALDSSLTAATNVDVVVDCGDWWRDGRSN